MASTSSDTRGKVSGAVSEGPSLRGALRSFFPEGSFIPYNPPWTAENPYPEKPPPIRSSSRPERKWQRKLGKLHTQARHLAIDKALESAYLECVAAAVEIQPPDSVLFDYLPRVILNLTTYLRPLPTYSGYATYDSQTGLFSWLIAMNGDGKPTELGEEVATSFDLDTETIRDLLFSHDINFEIYRTKQRMIFHGSSTPKNLPETVTSVSWFSVGHIHHLVPNHEDPFNLGYWL